MPTASTAAKLALIALALTSLRSPNTRRTG